MNIGYRQGGGKNIKNNIFIIIYNLKSRLWLWWIPTI